MKKILIAEDDLSIQDTLSEFLSREKDYIIITAEDGKTDDR